MSVLLQLNTSLNGADGLSSVLGSELVDAWRAAHPAGEVVVRDLAAQPVPHLTGGAFAGFTSPPEDRDAEGAAAVRLSDTLIDELRRADTIVLGVPMYNFQVPSTLKAWFDYVVRAGETFRYTAEGPQGLLTGKRAYVVAVRGGAYEGSPADTQTPYLRQMLSFVGIDDVTFVYVERTAMGDEARESAVAAARERIASLELTAAA